MSGDEEEIPAVPWEYEGIVDDLLNNTSVIHIRLFSLKEIADGLGGEDEASKEAADAAIESYYTDGDS